MKNKKKEQKKLIRIIKKQKAKKKSPSINTRESPASIKCVRNIRIRFIRISFFLFQKNPLFLLILTTTPNTYYFVIHFGLTNQTKQIKCKKTKPIIYIFYIESNKFWKLKIESLSEIICFFLLVVVEWKNPYWNFIELCHHLVVGFPVEILSFFFSSV